MCYYSRLAFYMEGRWATTATTSIFLAAAVTDWLDGYIARKVCALYLENGAHVRRLSIL